jgi:DNA uptake protein ComE-like DNA-binding protein
MKKLRGALIRLLIIGFGFASIMAKAEDGRPAIVAPIADRSDIRLIRKKTHKEPALDRAAVLIELNDGSFDQIDRLPGIDPDLAFAIIQHRPYGTLSALAAKHVLSDAALSKFVSQFPPAE